MKTVSTDGGLTLSVATPQVPLLALDTNVLIEAGRSQAKARAADPRVTRFLMAAQSKVDEGKLLCFETNQREEYLGSPDAGAIGVVSAALTRGLRAHTSEIVYNNELTVGMRGFLAGEKNLSFSLAARFDVNPDELARSSKGSVHRSSAGLLAPIAMLSRAMKPIDLSALSEIKKSYDGMTFKQARERELGALARRFQAPMIAADAATYGDLWRSCGGSDPDGFKRFLDSPYCMNLPKSEIGAEIFAEVMVSRQPIESGDLHDVAHLSIALPVARFVLTDARMRDRLQQLKLDQRWTVGVFSIKSLSDLVDAIEML